MLSLMSLQPQQDHQAQLRGQRRSPEDGERRHTAGYPDGSQKARQTYRNSTRHLSNNQRRPFHKATLDL